MKKEPISTITCRSNEDERLKTMYRLLKQVRMGGLISGTLSAQPVNLPIWIVFGSILFAGASMCFGQGKADKLVIARLQYIYKARQNLGDSATSFGGKQYDLPLIHYDGDTTFISNPTGKFLDQFRPKPVLEKNIAKIFKLDYRIDSAPFYLKVSMSMGEDTTVYDYYAPFIKCSSREEFEKVKGGPISTQKWSALVIHEFFHAYQFFHKELPAKQYLERGRR